eukprot:g1479.t1
MDELMELIGLRAVKEEALAMYAKVHADSDLLPENRVPKSLNFAFMGNPGTGKTTVGRIFGKILHAAYALEPKLNPSGKGIVDQILVAAEDCRTKLSIILAGYKDEIEEKLYGFNTGMPSRFKSVFFEDFDKRELRQIWDRLLKKYNKNDKGWRVLGHPNELGVSSVATMRVARGIGRKGFGNARDIRTLFERAVNEAQVRSGRPPSKDADEALVKLYNNKPDEYRRTIIVEDIIGVAPRDNPEVQAVEKELAGFVGLKAVKERIEQIVDAAERNYQKELGLEEPDALTLNRLFVGNPGTGKTTIASLYGRVLKALRLLSNGAVESKTASDFVGSAVGESQNKTKTIIELAQGKVLLIDEAYALDDGLYGRQALNTIVEKVDPSPGEDIAVVMCGYEVEMNKMFRDQNPGLRRRFNPQEEFKFDDFKNHELLSIMKRAARKDGLRLPAAVARAGVKFLAAKRAMPNFGNAGAVKSMISAAKLRLATRLKRDSGSGGGDGSGGSGDSGGSGGDQDGEEESKGGGPDGESRPQAPPPSTATKTVARTIGLTVGDLVGPEEEARASSDPFERLRRLKNAEKIESQLRDIQTVLSVWRQEGGERPEIGNCVFVGNAGTGKVRKIMGLGVDLTGNVVGQTKDIVEAKMKAAAGGILFIDEAYDLGIPPYGEEAMTTLLRLLTEPDYANDKTIVIVAGYADDMADMMARNQGMRSRFKRTIKFESCVELVGSKAEEGNYEVTVDANAGERHNECKKQMEDEKKQEQEHVCNGDGEETAVADGDAGGDPKVDVHKMTEDERKKYLAEQRRKAEEYARKVEEDLERREKELARLDELRRQQEEEERKRKEEEEKLRKALEEARRKAEQKEMERIRKEQERLKKEREEAERRRRELEEKLRREAEELRRLQEQRRKEQEEQRKQEKLRRMQTCPASFRWRKVSGGYWCEGGVCWVSDSEIERYRY